MPETSMMRLTFAAVAAICSLLWAAHLCLAQDMSLMGAGGGVKGSGGGGGGINTPVLLYGTINGIAAGSNVTTSGTAPVGALVVVACFSGETNSTFSGITESAGNTYTQAATSTPTAGYYTSAIYFSGNIANSLANGSTMRCNTNGAHYAAAIYYVTGAAGNLDTHTSGTAAATNTISLSTGTLAQAMEIVWGAAEVSNAWGTFTEASGFSNTSGFPAGGFDAAYRIVNATTSVTYNPSGSTGGNNITAALASFK